MKLPGATAYMEALQDPATCFADPELAGASAALGPLGLPRAVSGNVAVVFRLDGSSGRSWAVRCFVRPLEAERARYEALRSHLATLDSSWRVGFDLQPLGIRVDGGWWPVVKMEWTTAEPLLSYVRRHLWDGAALGYLAARVAALAERLRADGVAHGDLQHGNLLVAPGGDLRLVDYDGMYVPALAGWAGTERGHRNYQHPGRAVGDFGPHLDSFSAWSIYASIAALAADPLLWGRLDGGEEALLLRHHDLEQPGRSAAFAAMEASDGPGVADLAALLRSFLALRPDEVPPLSHALGPAPACPAAGGVPTAPGGAGSGATGRPGPSWLPAKPSAAVVTPTRSGGAVDDPPVGAAALAAGEAAMRRAWSARGARATDETPRNGPGDTGGVPATGEGGKDDDAARTEDERRRSLYDALVAAGPVDTGPGAADPPLPPAPAPAVAFGGDLREARRTVAGSGAGAVVLLLTVAVGLPLLVALVGAVAVAGAGLAQVRRLFLRTPEARAAHQVGAVLAAPRRAAGDAVAAVDRLARGRAEVSTGEDAAARDAERDRARLRARQDAELRDVDVSLEATLASLVARERAIGVAEQEARTVALAALQSSVVDAQLAKHSLVSASAAGVSDKIVHLLALDDVRSAADFTDVLVEKKGGVVVCRDGRRIQVNGVDRRQADAILQWRRRVAGAAQLKVPDALPPKRQSAIRAEHNRLRSALAAEEESARVLARRRADGIRERWKAEQDAVLQRQNQVEADAARQRVEIDRDLARARKDVAEAEWHLGQHQEEVGTPAKLGLVDYLRQAVAVGPLAGIAGRPGGTHRHSSRDRMPSSQP